MTVRYIHLLDNSSWKSISSQLSSSCQSKRANGSLQGRRYAPQSTHRVTIADFWRSFHHDGKSAQAGEGWWVHCTPTPFHSIYHHLQSCSVRSSWEGRHTPTISSLPLYVVCDTHRPSQYKSLPPGRSPPAKLGRMTCWISSLVSSSVFRFTALTTVNSQAFCTVHAVTLCLTVVSVRQWELVQHDWDGDDSGQQCGPWS